MKGGDLNKNEIWQTIKNDKSTVYGEPILDVFLKTTTKLEPHHFKELSQQQKKEISSEIASYVFAKTKDPQEAFSLLGTDNFNKIENPLGAYAGNREYYDQLVDLVKKHHKNAKKLAYYMCYISKNPEDIINHFGIDTIYNSNKPSDLDKSQSSSMDSNLTKQILISAFKKGKLKEVGELLSEKIQLMNNEDLKKFILDAKVEPSFFNADGRGRIGSSISNSKEIEDSRKEVQDFVLKYREKLTGEHARVLNYHEKDKDFLWRIFEKQGIYELRSHEIYQLLKMPNENIPDEKAIKIIGKENIKKAVLNDNGELRMMPFSSLVANLIKLDLGFFEFFGPEIISLIDHIDIEHILNHYKSPLVKKQKQALELIKKYHKNLDKRIERSPRLADLIAKEENG